MQVLLISLVLVGLGIVMVYSSSSVLASVRFADSSFFLQRQIVRALIGLVIMFVLMWIPLHLWARGATLLLLAGLASLVLVMLFGYGSAQRWIAILGLSFQPSEFAKFALVLYLADVLVRKEDQIQDLRSGFLPRVAVIAVVLGLIALQPDLGTALAIGLVCGLMFYIAGVRLWHLLGTGLVMVPPLYTIIFVFGYRKDRILDFLSPSHDVQGAGYQVTQSLVALGSGGLTGAGLGQSLQKYSFLPEPHTDFVFSILGEELGLVGTLGLLLLFLAFARLGLRIARSASDLQGFLLASGITCMVLAYALVNMGVCTGLLPTTGLPLPFISYGGSSLFLTLVAAGILINVGRRVASDPGALPRPDEAWRLRPLPQPVRVGGGGR